MYGRSKRCFKLATVRVMKELNHQCACGIDFACPKSFREVEVLAQTEGQKTDTDPVDHSNQCRGSLRGMSKARHHTHVWFTLLASFSKLSKTVLRIFLDPPCKRRPIFLNQASREHGLIYRRLITGLARANASLSAMCLA